MYDYGFRIYNPSIGKFLSVDPLAADFASWSPYTYVLDNPIRLVDTDGKAPVDPIVIKNKNTRGSSLVYTKGEGNSHMVRREQYTTIGKRVEKENGSFY